MGQIIDFERAKSRLRPRGERRAYIVLEIPSDFVDEMDGMDGMDSPVVMARIDLMVF